MLRIALVLIAIAACGGPAMQNVQLVNKTPRTIAEVYLFPAGSQNQGASRGTLAPGATMNIKMKAGNVEIRAVQEKIQVSEKERDVREASSTFQLVRAMQLILHESDQPPPDLKNKDVIGVTFRIPAAKKQPEPEPAPEAP
jgi:hypothetical protein